MKHYSPTDYVNGLEEYKVLQKAGLEARRIVASFSKRFFSEHVPCNGFSDIENLEGPEIFFEDELVCILNMEEKLCPGNTMQKKFFTTYGNRKF